VSVDMLVLPLVWPRPPPPHTHTLQASAFSLSVLSLSGFHTYLILSNKTTLEGMISLKNMHFIR
jgi:hypothetical protein